MDTINLSNLSFKNGDLPQDAPSKNADVSNLRAELGSPVLRPEDLFAGPENPTILNGEVNGVLFAGPDAPSKNADVSNLRAELGDLGPGLGDLFTGPENPTNEDFTGSIFDFPVFPLTEEIIKQIGSYFKEVAQGFIGISNDISAEDTFTQSSEIIAQNVMPPNLGDFIKDIIENRFSQDL